MKICRVAAGRPLTFEDLELETKARIVDSPPPKSGQGSARFSSQRKAIIKTNQKLASLIVLAALTAISEFKRKRRAGNYTVRLYRPRNENFDGTWKFPEAQPVP